MNDFASGDRVRISEEQHASLPLQPANFEDDVIMPAFKARDNWTCLNGLTGHVIGPANTGFELIIVLFPCGSEIGIPAEWLVPISPLEQLAEAADDFR